VKFYKSQVKNCPPDLNPKTRAALEKEIAEFDEVKTRALIERESVSGQDVNTQHDIEREAILANPDLLRDDEGVNFDKPVMPRVLAEAKKAIDDILSPRALQVWKLCMRQGLSHEKAGEILHISKRNIETILRRSRQQIEARLK